MVDALDDDDLARYEEALLDVLARSSNAEETRAALIAAAPSLAAYIGGFEPKMLRLGQHLSAKWARRC